MLIFQSTEVLEDLEVGGKLAMEAYAMRRHAVFPMLADVFTALAMRVR
jgi:hypothetical protein